MAAGAFVAPTAAPASSSVQQNAVLASPAARSAQPARARASARREPAPRQRRQFLGEELQFRRLILSTPRVLFARRADPARPASVPAAASASLTEEFLSRVPEGGALERLRAADRVWTSIRAREQPAPPRVIEESSERIGREIEFDVAICGGTLGVFLGAALASKGYRVAIIERGELRGRVQEWNISRREMETFTEMNLLTQEQLDKAICTEYNPGRVGFKGGKDLWVRDVLNVGVDPVYLLEQLKNKFISSGGTLLERTPFEGAIVHPDGVELKLGERRITARLLLDAMGNLSPIAKQARGGRKPDSVCAVVGTCATGFKDDANETGDLIYSFTEMQLSLGVPLSEISPLRALYGFFPSYRESPLQTTWNRVQHVGDSSGNQSPLSFGGFGSMVRHLRRLTDGISGALQNDQLSRDDLALLQPYQPSVSVAWLFQKTMSARVGQGRSLSPNHINDVLNVVFAEMEARPAPPRPQT
eukprot:tig00021441_g21550.t1